MKRLFFAITMLLLAVTTFSQKQENHLRFYASGGAVLNVGIHPAITTGVSYNLNNFYPSAHITLQGDKRRAIFEARTGFMLGKSIPFIIPHVGVSYEFRTRTPMLYKSPDAPSWSDPDNIVLPARIRPTYGVSFMFPSPWEKATIFGSYHTTTRGVEYTERTFPEGKGAPLRGNGVGQLHVNKWEETSTIPSFIQVGIIVRATWSTCDN
jgi:hypothetical protein